MSESTIKADADFTEAVDTLEDQVRKDLRLAFAWCGHGLLSRPWRANVITATRLRHQRP